MSELATQPGVGTPRWIGDPPTFTVVHPVPRPARVGVVLCSPYGWDEVASYRMRYEWGQHLAAVGFPTIRFDWPGTGDSAGEPSDPHRLAAWCRALTDVAAHLRATTQVRTVAAIGIGLGGLIAIEAIRRGAPISNVAAWGPPRDGREFVRGERTFSNMQDAERGGHESLLPEGWIQSGGFVLSAEMASDLLSVDLRSGAAGLRRVMLLDRDGLALPEEVSVGLRSTGVEVTKTSGKGYGSFVHRAETAELPVGVLTALDRWLVDAPSDDTAPGVATPAAAERTSVAGGHERAVRIPLADGAPFAVVTVPDRPRSGAPTLVLLPAWAMRRSGPNRMWTEIARQACAEGFTSARVDLSGIGDAEGSREWLRFPENATDPRIIAEICQIIDGLVAEGVGESFVTCGVSSGGFWAFKSMLADRRIGSAVAINTAAHLLESSWHAALIRRKARAALSPDAWMRIIRGEGQLRQTRVFAYMRQQVMRRRTPTLELAAPVSFLEALDQIEDDEGRLTLAFTSNEEMRREMQRRGLWEQISSRPCVTLEDIIGLDHNVRTLAAQRDVRRIVLEHVRRVADETA